MNYSTKDIIIGFVIIILVVLGIIFYKRNNTVKLNSSPVPTSITFQKELEDSFKFNIPDNIKSIELKDVSGGDGRGIATDSEVLADIEDPKESYFYEAWLEDSNNGKLISLGRLQMSKGGWLITYNKNKLENAQKIIISLEKVNDGKLEKRILEGSFN